MSTGNATEEYELTLQSRRGIRVGVRLMPDGVVEIGELVPSAPNHNCAVSLDGTSARVLRDWLRAELA